MIFNNRSFRLDFQQFMPPHVVGSFAEALKVTRSHWKWQHSTDRLAFHNIYGPVLYHFRGKARYWSKNVIFSHRTCIRCPVMRSPSEYFHNIWYRKTKMVVLPDGEKVREYVYSFCYNTWTWQTDGQTDTARWHRLHNTMYSIAWQKN